MVDGITAEIEEAGVYSVEEVRKLSEKVEVAEELNLEERNRR